MILRALTCGAFRFTLLNLCKINQLQCLVHNFLRKKIHKSRKGTQTKSEMFELKPSKNKIHKTRNSFAHNQADIC